MTHRSRRSAVRVAACATAVLLLAVIGSSAQAASLGICTGTEAVSFSPAMTLTSHSGTVAFSDTVNCTSSDSGAATGSAGGSYTASYGCVEQITPAGTVETLTITWADSTTSVLSYTDVTGAVLVGGSYVDTLTGSVTSGKFAGATVTTVVADPTLSVLQCLTTGISSITGVVTLTITGT